MIADSKSNKLRSLKQDLVRAAIRDAAIKLFGSKGFDATTVEEIAHAAGVSRRSYFRYFASKDDLLSQNVLDYGEVLTATVKSCPADMSSLEVIRRTVMAGVEHNLRSEVKSREIIEISLRSALARQAHQSRLVDVEQGLVDAFSRRRKKAGNSQMEPHLLAGVTLALMHSALMSWFTEETPDLGVAAEGAFRLLDLTLHKTKAAGRRSTKVPKSVRRSARDSARTAAPRS